MELFQDRLKQELDVSTTCDDYGILLQLLSYKVGIEVDALREGKGSWTYKDWNRELNKD